MKIAESFVCLLVIKLLITLSPCLCDIDTGFTTIIISLKSIYGLEKKYVYLVKFLHNQNMCLCAFPELYCGPSLNLYHLMTSIVFICRWILSSRNQNLVRILVVSPTKGEHSVQVRLQSTVNLAMASPHALYPPVPGPLTTVDTGILFVPAAPIVKPLTRHRKVSHSSD